MPAFITYIEIDTGSIPEVIDAAARMGA